MWLNLITLPSPGTVTVHASCHVTYHRGGKNDPHFKNPWPRFTYSLCHFNGATTKFKPRYMRKIVFIPLWRLQSLLRMRSITWPVHRGSPKTTRNNYLTPTYLSLYNFYGAATTIKGSFILEHPHVKAIFGCKKTKPSQNGSFLEI